MHKFDCRHKEYCCELYLQLKRVGEEEKNKRITSTFRIRLTTHKVDKLILQKVNLIALITIQTD
jgi:hypothetical protein